MFQVADCFSKHKGRFHVLAAVTFGLMASLVTQTQAATILTPTKDNYLGRCTSSGSETNYGGDVKLRVRSGDGNWSSAEPKSMRSILHFDLSGIDQPVLEAKLGLYYYKKWVGGQDPVGRTYQVRRLLNDWVEGIGTKPGIPGTTVGSSWENRSNDGTTAEKWTTYYNVHIDDHATLPDGYEDPPGYTPADNLGGGDFPYRDYNGTDHWGGDEVWATADVPDSFGWMEWDVTGLVQKWQSGEEDNYGLVVLDAEELWHPVSVYDPLYGEDPHGWGAWFYSKDYEGKYEHLRPYLEVTSVPEPSTVVLLVMAFLAFLCVFRYARRWKR